MFSSGAVKLLSGDPTWRDLTALRYHYWTQPLPTWIGWYASLLPDWFQTLSWRADVRHRARSAGADRGATGDIAWSRSARSSRSRR